MARKSDFAKRLKGGDFGGNVLVSLGLCPGKVSSRAARDRGPKAVVWTRHPSPCSHPLRHQQAKIVQEARCQKGEMPGRVITMRSKKASHVGEEGSQHLGIALSLTQNVRETELHSTSDTKGN